MNFALNQIKGKSFIYNGDAASGVIDTMLANQVALGFTEATGDTGDDDDIENITATNKIIPGLRYTHDATTVPAGTSVGAITGGDSTDGYRGTAHTLVTRNATTGAESVSNTSGGADTNGTGTYSAGFGDLVEITAEADTAIVDLEVLLLLNRRKKWLRVRRRKLMRLDSYIILQIHGQENNGNS